MASSRMFAIGARLEPFVWPYRAPLPGRSLSWLFRLVIAPPSGIDAFPFMLSGPMGAFGVAILVSRLNPTVRPEALARPFSRIQANWMNGLSMIALPSANASKPSLVRAMPAHDAVLSSPATTPFSEDEKHLEFSRDCSTARLLGKAIRSMTWVGPRSAAARRRRSNSRAPIPCLRCAPSTHKAASA